jgi:hypothetical protein
MRRGRFVAKRARLRALESPRASARSRSSSRVRGERRRMRSRPFRSRKMRDAGAATSVSPRGPIPLEPFRNGGMGATPVWTPRRRPERAFFRPAQPRSRHEWSASHQLTREDEIPLLSWGVPAINAPTAGSPRLSDCSARRAGASRRHAATDPASPAVCSRTAPRRPTSETARRLTGS